MSPPKIEYNEIVRLISHSIIHAIPEGTGPTLALNALLNVAAHALSRMDPLTRTDEYTRTIVFLIGEALRQGVDLDDLRRYCQQLATENERTFFHDPA